MKSIKSVPFNVLEGLVIEDISGAQEGSEEIIIKTKCGRTFVMSHCQDCCESVEVKLIKGDISKIIGSYKVEKANDKIFDNETPKGFSSKLNLKHWGSFTYTIFKIRANQNIVKIVWLGESNGYYGEDVAFEEHIKGIKE